MCAHLSGTKRLCGTEVEGARAHSRARTTAACIYTGHIWFDGDFLQNREREREKAGDGGEGEMNVDVSVNTRSMQIISH